MFIVNLLLFFILLSSIVTIHEFGHFIVAKIFNVYCGEFSIGMGPVIYQKEGKETTFSIRALPIGGFCALAGDSDNSLETDVDETDIPIERTLKGINAPKKIAIMLAGVVMNLVLAVFIIAMIFLNNGAYAVSPEPVISAVQENTPAYRSGFQSDDVIKKITFDNGTSCTPDSFEDMTNFIISFYDGEGEWHFEVERDGKTVAIDVVPQYSAEEERYLIGIVGGEYTTVKVNIINCWKYAVSYCMEMISLIFTSLASLIRGNNLNQLSGPVGVYSATSQAVSMGMVYYFNIIAIISLNVGVFNLLPLPVLDGGRILITVIETIIRRPLNEKIQNVIMSASLALLLMIALFATFQDIFRLFN